MPTSYSSASSLPLADGVSDAMLGSYSSPPLPTFSSLTSTSPSMTVLSGSVEVPTSDPLAPPVGFQDVTDDFLLASFESNFFSTEDPQDGCFGLVQMLDTNTQQSQSVDVICFVGEESAVAENCLPVPKIASLPTASAKLMHDDALAQPEDFPVDGEPRPLSPTLQKMSRSKNALVKYHRNRGEAYTTEKSNKEIPAKNPK